MKTDFDLISSLHELLIAVRDRAIEVQDGEQRHNQTDDELFRAAARFEYVDIQKRGENK